MIFRLFAQAVALVLLVAVVGIFLDFEIVDVAVSHLTGGLQELVETGKHLSGGEAEKSGEQTHGGAPQGFLPDGAGAAGCRRKPATLPSLSTWAGICSRACCSQPLLTSCNLGLATISVLVAIEVPLKPIMIRSKAIALATALVQR